MEQVLYYITLSRELLISFLCLMFFIGIICFLSMKEFKQNKKWKVIFYGLFLQMTNFDILKLSIIIVKSFIVFYAICVTDKIKIYISLIIIIILTVIYSIIYFKRIFHEISSSIIQILGIYMAFIINNYAKEVDNSNIVMVIYMFIITAVIFFTTYIFLKEIDIISQKRAQENNKSETINRKELDENG